MQPQPLFECLLKLSFLRWKCVFAVEHNGQKPFEYNVQSTGLVSCPVVDISEQRPWQRSVTLPKVFDVWRQKFLTDFCVIRTGACPIGKDGFDFLTERGVVCGRLDFPAQLQQLSFQLFQVFRTQHADPVNGPVKNRWPGRTGTGLAGATLGHRGHCTTIRPERLTGTPRGRFHVQFDGDGGCDNEVSGQNQ